MRDSDSGLDTSRCGTLFSDSRLNQFGGITNLGRMYEDAQPDDTVPDWDVSGMTDMRGIFTPPEK